MFSQFVAAAITSEGELPGMRELLLTESEIMRQITDWLSLHRVFWYRQNSGAAKAEHNGKKRFFRFGAMGSPDIICIVKGQYIGVEVKRKYGHQSQQQVTFQMSLEAAGAAYILAHSFDEFLAQMENLARCAKVNT